MLGCRSPAPPTQAGQFCSLSARAIRVAFSPDGQLLASISPTRIQVWELSTRTLLWEKLAPEAGEQDSFITTDIEFTDLAIAPDGHILATVRTDGTLTEWDLRTGEKLRTALVPKDHNRIAISPDGEWLAINAYLVGETFIWDRASWKPVAALPRTRGPVAFSPGGDLLLVGGADGVPRLLEVGSWQPALALPPLPGLLAAASFSPDGDLLALAGWDSLVWVYDVGSGELVHTLVGHREPVTAVAFSLDGRALASGGRDELVLVWDVASGEMLMGLDLWGILRIHAGASPAFQAAVRRSLGVRDLDFGADGLLATCGVGSPDLGWLQLWRLERP